MKVSIIFLHEFGAPEHHLGLTHLANENGATLRRREFGIIRQFAKGVAHFNLSMLTRAFSNCGWLLASWFGVVRNQRIVLGIAPFDWKILFLIPIISFNTIYWHTSWPYWDGFEGERYPNKLRFGAVRWIWQYFIQNKLRGIFFVTEYAQNNFHHSFGTSLPTWVVYHSFDPAIYFPKERSIEDVISVGFVGRLEPSKGIATVFAISRSLANSPFRFVIAGTGAMKSVVEAEAANNSNGLSYKGYLTSEKLGELFRNIDFLLVPSIRTDNWEEAFGMVIIEAMACGVVPIATNHPGPTELMTGQLAANVFAEDQFQEGAVGILLRSKEEPEYLEMLKHEAMRLSQRYEVNAVAKRWSEILCA